MLKQIINFVASYPYVIIILLVGVFNASVRIAQKTKDQRARRDALNHIAHQKHEALRTGQTTSTPSSHGTSRVDPKTERQERIEALRQERMEQLRALREKRAGTTPTQAQTQAQTVPSSVSQHHPNMPPIPVGSQGPGRNLGQGRVQPPPSRPRAHQPVAHQSTQQSTQQSTHQSAPRRSPPPAARQARQARQAPPAHQAFSSQRRRPSATAPKASSARKAGEIETNRSSKASQFGSKQPTRRQANVGSAQSARAMLRSRSSIRQAMILREILDSPIALRDQDIASGSLFS